MARPSLTFMAAAAAALGLFAGGVTSLASCEDTQSYVYSAQKYDPAADCVAAYKAIEVVNGSGASSTCPPICLTVGSDLFVSTMCPPLPTIATAEAADASDCIAALAAVKAGSSCDNPPEAGADSGDEGGDEDSSTPDAEPDAAVPIDASDSG